MATVRINDDLRDEVKRRAEGLFGLRIQEADTRPAHMTGELFLRLALEQDPEMAEDYRRAAQRGWLEKHGVIRVEKLAGHHISEGFQFATQTPLVPGWGGWSGKLAILSTPETEQLLGEYLAWKNNKQAVRAQCQTFVKTVETLMKKHSTLRQALGEWPALWELLDQATKDKHNEQVERKPKGEKVDGAAVDTSLLNSGLVTAKIVGEKV